MKPWLSATHKRPYESTAKTREEQSVEGGSDVMVHVPSHTEIPRKMMLWRMQGNHLIKRNAPQINIEAS